jgi:cytidyltransferase-like protein
MNPKRFDRIGMVARWKPVHLGHLAVLHALCEQANHALIGIGSANRYNARNPFTLEETTDMLRLALAGYDNYTLVPVPDLDDGPRWRLMLLDLFGRWTLS